MMISAILTQLSATTCYPLDLLSQLVESPVTLSQPRMHPKHFAKPTEDQLQRLQPLFQWCQFEAQANVKLNASQIEQP